MHEHGRRRQVHVTCALRRQRRATRCCARRMYTYICKCCARPTALLRQHVLLHQRHDAAFGPQHIVLARERDLSALPRAAAVLCARGMEYQLAVPVQAEGEVQQAAGKCWLRQRVHGGQGLFVARACCTRPCGAAAAPPAAPRCYRASPNTAKQGAVGGEEWGGSTHIAPVQLRGDVSECACSRRVTKAAACTSALQPAAEAEQPRHVLGAQRFGKRLNLDGSGER